MDSDKAKVRQERQAHREDMAKDWEQALRRSQRFRIPNVVNLDLAQ